ncbi:MAG TPA: hypothetical protein VFS05_13185 [Gemmatimonadaceae bacterium]|nr:hypothetical protein [Gemmatimonadaceae bacterium]
MRTRSAALTLVITLAAVAAPSRAQDAPASAHDEHHGHDEQLHFSHPLVTESPSPDTKLRLDYLWTRTGDPLERVTERGVRLEGELAFTEGLSLAVTLPYTWRSAAGLPDASGLGNTELSLKGASLRWGDRGLLVGGGVSVGLPTGSDARGIGTSRTVELEPFVDFGLARGGLQIVGFGRYGTTLRNPDGMDAERELSFDGSVLHQVARLLEVLVEVEVVHGVGGEERGTASSIAPGLKLYPFTNRSLMFGVSAPLGLGGEARDTRGVLVSAFYHF